MFGTCSYSIMEEKRHRRPYLYRNILPLSPKTPVFGVSDFVRHKPGSMAKEDGKSHEIVDLGTIFFYLGI